MEFSEQYLNYEEYKSLGGTLDIMPFNILEFESRKRIDERTQNRLKNIVIILTKNIKNLFILILFFLILFLLF